MPEGQVRHRRSKLAVARAGLGLAAALAAAGAAQASDPRGQFAIKGGGAATCRAFSAARAERSPDLRLFEGWVDGYLTAANQMTPDTFDIAPWQTTGLLLEMLTAYCRSQPEQSFALAVNRLMVALRPDRVREGGRTVQVGNGSRAIPLYEEVVRRAQAVLIRDKLLAMPEPNGVYDPTTRAAVERFQRERRLSVSGLLDQATLYTLFQKPEDAAPAAPAPATPPR
jgi:hypothetical protein